MADRAHPRTVPIGRFFGCDPRTDTGRKGWNVGRELRKYGTEPFSLLFGCQLATLGLLRQTPSYSFQEADILAYPQLSLWLARALSVAVLFAASVAIGRGASLLAHRRLLALNGAALVAGSAVTLFFASTLPLYLIGPTLIGISHAWVLICWAEFLASLATTDRTRCIARSALIAVSLVALVGLAPSPAKAALFMVAACGSIVGVLPFSRPPAAPALVGPVDAGKDGDGETLRGALSRLPVELFVLMASYAMLFRMLVFFDFPVHDEALFFACASLLRIGGMTLLLAYLSRMRFTPSARQIIMPLLFLTVVGVALLPVSGEPLSSFSVAIVESSWTFFYTIMWLVLFELGSNRKRGPLLSFLGGWTVMNALLLAAAPLAALFKEQVSAGTLSLAALALVIAYMLSVALLMLRKKPAGQEAAAPPNPAGGPSWKAGQEEFHRAIAERFGLTRRETDVFELLVQGYSLPAIEERLVLSHSTVKGHARSIYRKFEVDGKQSLIEKAAALRPKADG